MVRATYHYQTWLPNMAYWYTVSSTDAKRAEAEQELKSKAATLGGRWRLISAATRSAVVHAGTN